MGTTINYNRSVITVGNDNVVSANISESKWDLAQLNDALIDAAAKLPKGSQERIAATEALSYTAQKDEVGLISFIKKNASVFLSNLFSSAASVFLVDFVNLLLKR